MTDPPDADDAPTPQIPGQVSLAVARVVPELLRWSRDGTRPDAALTLLTAYPVLLAELRRAARALEDASDRRALLELADSIAGLHDHTTVAEDDSS